MIASSLRFRMLAAAQKGGSPESCVWPCRPHSTLRPRGFNEAMKHTPVTKVTDSTILFIQQVAGNLKGGAVSDGDRPMAGRCLQEWQHESFAEDSVPTRPECYLQAGSGRSCFARKQIPGGWQRPSTSPGNGRLTPRGRDFARLASEGSLGPTLPHGLDRPEIRLLRSRGQGKRRGK
jgi:hypothetical protein